LPVLFADCKQTYPYPYIGFPSWSLSCVHTGWRPRADTSAGLGAEACPVRPPVRVSRAAYEVASGASDGAVPGAPHRGVPRSKWREGPPVTMQPVGSKGTHVYTGLVASGASYRALPGVFYEGVPGASYGIAPGASYGAAPDKSYGPWCSCVCTSCLYRLYGFLSAIVSGLESQCIRRGSARCTA